MLQHPVSLAFESSVSPPPCQRPAPRARNPVRSFDRSELQRSQSIAVVGGKKMAEMEEGKVDAFHRPQGYEKDAAYLAQVSSLYPCRARWIPHHSMLKFLGDRGGSSSTRIPSWMSMATL